jgi:hypothetical protein
MSNLRIKPVSITDYYTQSEVESLIANAGHITLGQLTTASGDIVSWVTSQGYVSQAGLTTVSGDIVSWVVAQDYVDSSQLATTSGDILVYVSANYIDNTEMATISGNITDQIVTWASGISFDPGLVVQANGAENTSIDDVTSEAMTDYSSPSPFTVLVTSNEYTARHGWEAFDHTYTDGNDWGMTSLPAAVAFGFGSAIIVNKMRWRSRDYSGRHCPRDWTIDGSNQDPPTIDTEEHWTNLASFTDQGDPGRSSWTSWYTWSNDTAYKYYRMRVTDRNVVGSTAVYCCVNEIEYVEAQWVAPALNALDVNDDNVRLALLSIDDYFSTISGVIVGQIPSDYITEAQHITTSGDIVAWVQNQNYVDYSQHTTSSGDIVAQIPSLTGYATESYVSANYIDNAEMTTISGDLVAQMGTGSVTEEQLTTTSGDIVSQVAAMSSVVTGSGVFLSDGTATLTHNLGSANHYTWVSTAGEESFSSELLAQVGEVYIQLGVNTDSVYTTGGTTASGFPYVWLATISGMVGEGGGGSGDVTTEMLTTTSGDIVSQIPTDYVTELQLTTTSGDLVSQMGTGSVTEEMLTTTSGDILEQLTKATIIAAEEIPQYRMVYADVTTSGYARLGEYDETAARANVLGMVTGAGGLSAEQTGELRLFGKVTNTAWSWEPNQDLWLASSGTLTQTQPDVSDVYAVPCGHSLVDPTEIWLSPKTGWKIGASSITAAGPLVRGAVEGRFDRNSDTELIWTPVNGNGIGLWNGYEWRLVTPATDITAANTATTLSGVALAVSSTYDVFAEWDSDDNFNYVFRHWDGPAVRGYTLHQHQGVYVHEDSADGRKRRWLGVLYMDDDSGAKFKDDSYSRLVVNYYNQKLLNCSSSGQGGGASFTSTSYISMTGFTIIRVILLEPMTILFSGNRALPNNGGRCKSRVYVNGAAVDTEHWNVSSTSITYTDNNGAFTAKSDVTSIGYNYVELKKAMGSGTGLEWWSQLLFSIKG